MQGAPCPASVPAQTAVLTLPAEIDITNARRLCGEVGAALVSGAAVVVADMTATTFCDSSGARILVLAWEQAAVNGIDLRIVVPSAAVRRGFALMGLEGFLPFYPSLTAALTANPAPASVARPQRTGGTASFPGFPQVTELADARTPRICRDTARRARCFSITR